jgi:hypothetical protein
MNIDVADTAEADRLYREWMRDNLTRAAKHFGLDIDGKPTFGWLDRSIGAPALADGRQRWLRIVTEQSKWSDGDSWTGNLDANVITYPSKPRVLDICEWRDNPHRHVRAEVMTRMPGHPCSPTTTPQPNLALPAQWWNELTDVLNDVRHVNTNRVNIDQAKVDQRVRKVFGDEVSVTIRQWETVHGDLHWGNLFRNPFGIIDWELWGTGPVGTDPATLYLYSLAVPAVAEEVHAHFADVLDTADGRQARLLHRSTFGDHSELVTPLRQLVTRLIAELKLPFPRNEPRGYFGYRT